MGMLSRAAISFEQLMHRERDVPIGSRSGSRLTTTFEKLPIAIPGTAKVATRNAVVPISTIGSRCGARSDP